MINIDWVGNFTAILCFLLPVLTAVGGICIVGFSPQGQDPDVQYPPEGRGARCITLFPWLTLAVLLAVHLIVVIVPYFAQGIYAMTYMDMVYSTTVCTGCEPVISLWSLFVCVVPFLWLAAATETIVWWRALTTKLRLARLGFLAAVVLIISMSVFSPGMVAWVVS